MMKKNRSKMLDRIFAYGASFWRKAISIICLVHGFYFTKFSLRFVWFY